jgi:hypothetical protein
MKTINEIKAIFKDATGFEPTVSKNVGSMKHYISFKVNSKKFWDDWKNPKLREAANKINDTGNIYGVFTHNCSIDVHEKLIIDNP